MKTNYFKKKDEIKGQGITLAHAWFGKTDHPIPLTNPKKSNTMHSRKPVLSKLATEKVKTDE